MKRYQVVVGEEARFLSMRTQWGELLSRSTADPMFASWDWLSCWWRHHRDDFRLSLYLILAYDGERLVGIAPGHARDVVHKPGVRARRLELTGNLWRTGSTVMSERTGFIVDCDHPGVWDALSAAVIDQREWGDFVLTLSRTDGETFGSLRRMGSAAGFFVRDADPMSAYHIDLSGGFKGDTCKG